MTQSWDLRTHHIPAQPETTGGGLRRQQISTTHFWETDAGQTALSQAQRLAADGWELVSVVPETMATHNGAAEMGGVVTGYVLFFKRARES
jgi:hypothetical protein